MNISQNNNEHPRAAQASNVSKYRAARLPTSARQVPPPEPSDPAPLNNADAIVRSRSRYHRKQNPRSVAVRTTPATFSGAPNTKQRHLATLAALTGDPFISTSDDDKTFAPTSQARSRQLWQQNNGTDAYDERVKPSEKDHPGMQSFSTKGQHSREKLLGEAQNETAVGGDSENLPSIKFYNSHERTIQVEHRTTQQSSDHKRIINDRQLKPQGSTTKSSARKTPVQEAIGKYAEEGELLIEKGHGKPGQRPNAPISVTGTDALPPSFPGIDAPVSAINAGERRVLVKHEGDSTRLLVTPTTTTPDLVQAAAKALNKDTKIESYQLMEFFHQLALERVLRRYENIRDVMNSWDADADNHLFLAPKATEGLASVLEIDKVPDEQPGASVYLYHSSRPGRWDKRWTVLKGDGQIAISKKEGESETNLCHLSDFDIYTPTRHQKKKLKSPKKICFAVKSQQKSSMFLSGQNFIHFFATSDRDAAETFYRAIWGWRSWYLINVLGKGQATSSVPNGRRRPRRASIEFVPHSRPLDNLDPQVARQKSTTTLSPTEAPTTILATRKPSGSLPPTSFPRHFAHDMTQTEPDQPASAANGTPKRSSSQRQAQSGRPITSRSRSNSITSDTEILKIDHQGSRKSPSKREKLKPLVDLTPVFQEPPQHARKGRGVAAKPGKQLIDQIGPPESEPRAVMVPSATIWKRSEDATSAFEKNPSVPQRSGTRHQRGKLSVDEQRPIQLRERLGNAPSSNEAFTGGLLKT